MWQQINADLIRKNNLGSRLYPHRVNTPGKMQEITNRGIRSFETDVFFRPEGGFFEVGHHEGVMTGMTLESFLEKSPRDFEKIWLDVKDVTDAAVPGINKRLLELDKKFGLKTRVIVETANESSLPALLSDSGFHLSYYLPTEETLAVMEENAGSRKNLAEKISGIAKAQNVGAVSFDLRLYKFVKDYLEARLGSQVVYHTWYPGVTFESSNLLEEMQARDYFHDSRVKTILLPYASQFSL
ncbi:MAG: hypothetical protein OXI88_06525 [Gammaproteobacteria bacterium]|nr:hypothetical protein [Gammaproteobacteria bacterium]